MRGGEWDADCVVLVVGGEGASLEECAELYSQVPLPPGIKKGKTFGEVLLWGESRVAGVSLRSDFHCYLLLPPAHTP